jgi:hypothetical protein
MVAGILENTFWIYWYREEQNILNALAGKKEMGGQI